MAPKIEKLYKTEKGTYLPVRYAKSDIKEKIKAGKIPTRSDITGFLLVPVFDVTQTNAPEEDYPKLYPNRPQNYEFKGSQEQLEALEDTLKNTLIVKVLQLHKENLIVLLKERMTQQTTELY